MRTISFILILLPFITLAQGEFKQGYVMFDGNRGVETGFVEVPARGRGLNRCFFKSPTESAVQQLRADEITGFGFLTGEVFYSVALKQGDSVNHIFVKILVDGRLSLYLDEDVMILKLEDGSAVEMSAENYKEIFKVTTMTCPAIHRNLNKVRFKQKSIEKVVTAYNECHRNDPLTYDPNLKRTNISLGMTAGVDYSRMQVDATPGYPAITATDQQHIYTGLFMYIPFSKTGAIEVSGLFKPRQFVGIGISGSTVYELTARYDEILFPITYRFAFLKRKVTSLQATAGAAIPLPINQSFRMAREVNSSGAVTTTVSHPHTAITNVAQFNVGLGAEIRCSPKQMLLLQCNYYFGPASLSTTAGEVGSGISGIKLTLGFTFR